MASEDSGDPFEGVTITYRGEHGEGWVPQSKRHLWNYAVKTGQVDVPEPDDGGPWQGEPLEPGDEVAVGWLPPELAGRLVELPPEPQPRKFGFKEGTA